MKVVLFFFAILNVGAGILFDPPTWNTLRVKWGPPVVTDAFAPMPLTASDALKQGFAKFSSQCSGIFNGNRYMKGNDTAVILLYDVNGHIAGIQTAVPKSLVDPVTAYYPFETYVVYQQDNINGQDVYVLTAYFVDPDIICTTGRSDSDVKSQGTGSDLYLRNGTSLVKIPKTQNDMANTKWTKGPCFVTMGRHYWYNVQKDMKCQELFPIFLLYNRGMLTGFGFAMFGHYDFSKRYEFPPEATVKLFIDPVPDCIASTYSNIGGVTSLHVYFNTNPINLAC